MFVENAERNLYLRMTDEEILKAIDEAVFDYNVDGYTQHCEAEACLHCGKYTWNEQDVCDYIAEQLRKIYNEKYASDETESKTEPETDFNSAADFATFCKDLV